jgi:hypothetical protein
MIAQVHVALHKQVALKHLRILVDAAILDD